MLVERNPPPPTQQLALEEPPKVVQCASVALSLRERKTISLQRDRRTDGSNNERTARESLARHFEKQSASLAV
jgi:hypothetical protein